MNALVTGLKFNYKPVENNDTQFQKSSEDERQNTEDDNQNSEDEPVHRNDEDFHEFLVEQGLAPDYE